jgi:hypothetical protein
MANTTSGTTTFDRTFSIDEIIEDAFERIGLNSVAGYQLKSARRSLNILFQEWGNRGIGDYTNATDVPFRFVPCMVSGLAYYLSQKYQPQLVQQMKLLYEDELARALAEDGSASSTYITPKVYYPGV